jgi:HAE1 family hydrophobic/amphiphilic exporter-1
MSIPRIAIARPVTMFMISGIIILMGAISVTRLPVDLLPDVTYPTVSVFVRYPGVGPQEIEQLITRPIEQTVSAVAGLDQLNSTSSEGVSRVSLSFAWGTDLNEAMDDMRMRLDRVRGRMPIDAEPMQIFRQDSNAQPIMSLGIEGDYDRVTLREMAENQIGPRLERAEGVAAVTTYGGLRRQIHVQLSKEKIAALELPVERISALLRSENQNTPLGEVNQGERTYLLRSQAQFQSLDEIRNLVLMTRGGVPIYVRDVAEVVDTTEDVRSLLRINGRPGVRLSVQKQSGTNTVQVAENIRAEIERINIEMPNIKLNVLDDSSVYISRSIHSVQEHALLGAGLVTLIIFLFLRSFRSTLIVCTSIPISVVGTFALLYFAGYTLNIMTFGGLALGIGMVVDAAIVVLENAYRHMENGKDRVTAAVEGSEEVWGAIVASILTHIAVFVPLLFLTGIASILFKQLSVVVIFSLLMSLLVAVTIVPVLCAYLLKLPAPVEERKGLAGRAFTMSENFFERMDDAYRRFLHKALVHRPTVLALGVASVVTAVLMFPLLNTELAPQTDEGVVQLSAELAAGTRIERTDAIMSRLEQMTQQLVPEAHTLIASAGSGGFGGGGGTSRGRIEMFLVPKDQRERSSDQIAFELRRQLSGIPGVIVRANASGGNNQINRLMSGGQGNESRMGVEIRGEDLETSRRLAQEVQDLLQTTPGIADPRLARDEARPEMAVQIDRPKAALFG